MFIFLSRFDSMFQKMLFCVPLCVHVLLSRCVYCLMCVFCVLGWFGSFIVLSHTVICVIVSERVCCYVIVVVPVSVIVVVCRVRHVNRPVFFSIPRLSRTCYRILIDLCLSTILLCPRLVDCFHSTYV